MPERPSVLYHATTHHKARRYRETGRILKPVRGFTTCEAAKAWCCKVGRKVILACRVVPESCHKLTGPHNRWGEAWWFDGDVTEWEGSFDAEADA